MGAPVLPQDKVAGILRDYQGGDRVVDIAGRYGLSERHVYALARNAGLRKRTLGLTDDSLNNASTMVLDYIEQIAAMREVLPSNRKIAGALGYSTPSVALAMRDLERRQMIRVEAVHDSRRVIVVRTGAMTAGGPPIADGTMPSNEPRRVMASTPCTYCGARPDACRCGRSSW